MRSLFIRFQIACHVGICCLWGLDPYDWHTSSIEKGKMRRLSGDGKSWDFRDMTQDELDDEAWNRAIK
jgi:hypothetical protein